MALRFFEAFRKPELISSIAAVEDLAKADLKVIQEVVRQGEARIQAQLQVALASDTRSVGLASIQAAASAALIIAAAQDEISGANELAAYLGAIVLFAGSAIAGWAMRSVGFGFVGSKPHVWAKCIEEADDLKVCLAGSAVHLDKYIVYNDEIMRRHGVLTNTSLTCLACSPLVAGATLVASRFSFC